MSSREEEPMHELMSQSQELSAREARVIGESMRMRYYPLILDHAAGCTLWDVDGRGYLDLTAGWCVANTGYGHPAIADAIDRAYRRLSFACGTSDPHPALVELAERLAAGAPGSGPKKVSFVNSGSEANDGIAKLVPAARQRPRMISFIGGMHGVVAGSAALSGVPFASRFSSGGNVTR